MHARLSWTKNRTKPPGPAGRSRQGPVRSGRDGGIHSKVRSLRIRGASTVIFAVINPLSLGDVRKVSFLKNDPATDVLLSHPRDRRSDPTRTLFLVFICKFGGYGRFPSPISIPSLPSHTLSNPLSFLNPLCSA